MRTVSLRYLLPLAALFIAACGDDSIRSPDLPPDRLVSGPTITCTPAGPLAVGETTQCAATACVFQSVDAEGNVTRDSSRACPTATWSVNNDNGTITDTGLFTATKPGTVVVTGTIPGGSDDITITVSAACADSVADFTISPLNATTIAGSAPTTYRASLVLSDNSTVDVTSGTSWSSSDNRVTFTANVASTPADIEDDFTATITGTYDGSLLCDDVTGPATRTTSLTVTESTVITTGGICIGVIPPAVDFDGCRPDTGACVLPEAPIELAFTNPPQTRDLLIRARYTNGTECNVTNTATITSDNTGIATVSNGTVSGVGVGSTTIGATFMGLSATPRPVTVTAGQVLGANSLKVFTKQPFTETEQITFARANNNKFACVGSNNLVADGLAGNPPRAGLLTYALAATCAADMLDEDGNCTAVPPIDPENPPEEPQEASAEGFDAIVRTRAANEVTNPVAPESDLLDDNIVWNSVAGFWNGPEEGCDTEAVNTSSHVGDAYIDPRTLAVGDDGTPIEPAPDLDLPPGALQPNGVVYAVPGVRLGFSCVTATYTNPEDPTQTVTDGMTVLVLPVINDVLLQSGADPGGDKLCDALSPLFGSGPLLGLVQTTPVLSSLTASLMPLLEGLDAVPVDGLVTELQGGLSTLTAPLIALLNGTLLPPLTDGLCVVTSGLGTLLGALTGNPNDPDCAQDPDAEEPAP